MHAINVEDLVRGTMVGTNIDHPVDREWHKMGEGAEKNITSLLLVAMPFVPSSFLLLVVRPGAPSSVLASNKSPGTSQNASTCVVIPHGSRLATLFRHAEDLCRFVCL